MSLRNRLTRLEKMSGDGSVEVVREFFGLVRKYADDPEVGAAAESFGELMEEAQAALGHPITPREWLNDSWMEHWGLHEANNRLIRAVEACVVRSVECTEVKNEGARPPEC